MPALVRLLGLQQRSGFQLLAQLHAQHRAARGFGALVKQAFGCFAVIHARHQIMLFQHNRQIMRRVQRNHITGCAHRAFGGVLHKRAFAEFGDFHAFFVGKHHGHQLLADKLGLLVAQRKVG